MAGLLDDRALAKTVGPDGAWTEAKAWMVERRANGATQRPPGDGCLTAWRGP